MNGRTALVTGAGSGIGAATAQLLARDGASVLVCDIDGDAGSATVERLRNAGGRASFFAMDVTDPAAQREAVTQARRDFGGLDIAVNCAGISVGPTKSYAPVHEVEWQDWQRILDVNLNGVFHGLQAQMPAMIERGGGSIVNVGSIMSVVARVQLSAYVASKHAVLGLTKAAALDGAEHRIRVNSVGPGYVDTPLLARKDAATRRSYEQQHPLMRLALADEVAELIAWLCSPKAAFCTGSYHAIDGGYTAR